MQNKFPIRFLLSALISILTGIIIVLQPVPQLLASISDDAFYYQVIASNIANGKGITFDGLAMTNGFHPLYMAMSVPIHLLLNNRIDLILRVILVIDLLIYIATGYFLFVLCRKLFDPLSGELAGSAFLLNPWALMIIINGVETAFYLFFLVLTFIAYVNFKKNVSDLQKPFNRQFFVFISLYALTIYARTEAIIFIFCIFIDFAMNINFSGKINEISSQLRKFGLLFSIMLIGIGILMLPWVIWNIKHFGTFVQSSGSVLYYHTHQNLTITDAAYWRVIGNSFRTILMRAVLFSFQVVCLGIPLLLINFGKQFSSFQALPQEKTKEGSWKTIFVFALYAIGILSFYAFYLLRNQVWYFGSTVVVLSIIFSLLGRWFIMKNKNSYNQPKTFIWIYLVLTFIFGIFYWQFFGYSRYDAMLDGYQISEWLQKNTSDDSRIAAWSSGLIGYYSDRTVVNLDGVVNNEIQPFLEERNGFLYDMDVMTEYLKEKDIDYLTDIDVLPLTFHPETFEETFEIVESFPSSATEGQNIIIYRIK